jgi:hypothetical protein
MGLSSRGLGKSQRPRSQPRSSPSRRAVFKGRAAIPAAWLEERGWAIVGSTKRTASVPLSDRAGAVTRGHPVSTTAEPPGLCKEGHGRLAEG